MMKIIIWIASFFLILSSCTEPFDLEDELSGTPGKPVINGWISSFQHEYKVTVSRTIALNDELAPSIVDDAIVMLYDDEGLSVEAEYDSKLEAYFFPSWFYGVEGRTYWIEVTFANREVFQSEPQLMQPSPEIEEINYGDEVEAPDFLGRRRVAELNVVVQDPADERNYYLWLVENSLHTPVRPDSRLYLIDDDRRFNGQKKELVVAHVATEESAVRVRQLSLTRTGFQYFNLLNKINDQNEFDLITVDPVSNGFFSTPPVTLEGNIFQKSNETNFGAGYFGVYGHSFSTAFTGDVDTLTLREEFEDVCEMVIEDRMLEVDCFPDATRLPVASEDGWNTYLVATSFKNRLFTPCCLSFESADFISPDRNVRFESRDNPEDELNRDELILVVKEDFKGEVGLEIVASTFVQTFSIKFKLTVK
ncbi:MAG: DUF4249 domain-containing protein [Bacteroidota bacterium]